jgi:hypothetical protein
LTTERCGSVPMRAVPSRCQPAMRIGPSVNTSTGGAGRRQDLLGAAAMPCCSMRAVFSLIRYVIFGAGMPCASVSVGPA